MLKKFALCIALTPKIPKYYINIKDTRPLLNTLYNITPKKNKLYSIEHIVPKSFIKNKKLSSDLHNLMLYPCNVNMHRSNYKYVSDFKLYDNSYILDHNGNNIDYNKPMEDLDIFIKTNERHLFLPRKQYRGEIARACMYFLTTYPKYQDTIFNKVLDPFTLLTWHHEYPVECYEQKKNIAINELQKNKNVYVSYPELLVLDMQLILDKDLSVFKKYKY
jgi:deoxyribonuclease I